VRHPTGMRKDDHEQRISSSSPNHPPRHWEGTRRRIRSARPQQGEVALKIKLTSMLVEDQAKAFAFYTKILGFVKSKDIPLGE
jgi:hypothetical protein